MQRELLALARVLDHPRRPLVLILIGGAMSFTFLKALGCETGFSAVEPDLVPMAKKILEVAQARGIQVVLPEDVVAAMYPGDRDRILTVPAERIPLALAGLDPRGRRGRQARLPVAVGRRLPPGPRGPRAARRGGPQRNDRAAPRCGTVEGGVDHGKENSGAAR